MVAVPPDTAAYMQHNVPDHQADRRQLVDDRFGRMIVAGIHAHAYAVFYGVGQIKLMGTHGEAFGADSEQFSLQHVDRIVPVIRDFKNLIQRIL
ncbi:hypothetical protein SDC9_185733 [bioreactor metagenome]|uniref:Uncharacterized protein n=1 Tax=bioreactor metagenome TaxID=1076179 RepID=A0A645HJ37_9ZZZZ